MNNSRCTDGSAVKRAEIYRQAALLYENGKLGDAGRGSCSAICEAARPDLHHYAAYEDGCRGRLVSDYAAFFRPEIGVVYWGMHWGDSREERDDCRIIALCFMAAMIEAGDA